MLHELGHIFIAGINGADIRSLQIGAAKLTLQISEADLKKERWIILGGPLINLISAGIGLIFSGSVNNDFFAVNLMLSLFNLLPSGSLDGGRLIESIVSRRRNGKTIHIFISVAVSALLLLLCCAAPSTAQLPLIVAVLVVAFDAASECF